MDLPRPVAGEGELLVRISAAALNPFDAKIANGILRDRPHVFPLVLGVDAAGRVEEVGTATRRFQSGARIFGQFLHDPVGTGTYAEYAVVPERIGVSLTPSVLLDRDAAALPTAGMTAQDSLERLDPAPNSSLLLVGASGGIGSFVVPLARARGVRVVAVTRSASMERVRSLGATDVVDSERPDWPDRVRSIAPHGVESALDLMSDPKGFQRVLELVKSGGRAASTVYAAGSAAPPSSGAHAFNIDLHPSSGLLDRLTQEVLEHRIRIPVERTIPLEEAPQALAEIRAGRAVGKTVILLGEARSVP